MPSVERAGSLKGESEGRPWEMVELRGKVALNEACRSSGKDSE